MSFNTAMNFVVNWQDIVGECHWENFAKFGFFVLDDVFCEHDWRQLQNESGFVDYRAANLTQGQRIDLIRGDHIRWIDEHCPYGVCYLQAIDVLGKLFNRTFYTTIKRSEAHYAHYQAGFGYDWHSDNPKGRDERVVSAVFYLNDEWHDDDGGHIVLIDKSGTTQQLTPKGNRLVVFDSNLRHKVATTYKDRFSIATWLRQDM